MMDTLGSSTDKIREYVTNEIRDRAGYFLERADSYLGNEGVLDGDLIGLKAEDIPPLICNIDNIENDTLKNGLRDYYQAILDGKHYLEVLSDLDDACATAMQNELRTGQDYVFECHYEEARLRTLKDIADILEMKEESEIARIIGFGSMSEADSA